MHLVVGLGNPGEQYRTTGTTWGSWWWTSCSAAQGLRAARQVRGGAGRGHDWRENVLLCKPMEYMNVSGQSVARVAGFWKVGLADTIVVYDELDLPFGRLKLGSGGGHGGHNGMRSLIAALGDPGFARVRVGIGSPAPGRDPADCLLSDFSRAEADLLPRCSRAPPRRWRRSSPTA